MNIQNIRITNSDYIVVGYKGADGNGIVDIRKTSTHGLIDTYTIYYTDGKTDKFTVKNGQNGQNGKNGYTPIKGIDYWTNEDKIEIVSSATTQVETDIQPTLSSIEETANEAKTIAQNTSQALNNYYTKSQTDTMVNAKYSMPSGGIPSTDMTNNVQTSLGKADTSIQPTNFTYDSTTETLSITIS